MTPRIPNLSTNTKTPKDYMDGTWADCHSLDWNTRGRLTHTATLDTWIDKCLSSRHRGPVFVDLEGHWLYGAGALKAPWHLIQERLQQRAPKCFLVAYDVMPWNIKDFLGTGVERPALDHMGFKVESVDKVKRELESLIRKRAPLAPNPVGEAAGSEGEARLKLFSKCPFGQFHMSDPDGVLIDVAEK